MFVQMEKRGWDTNEKYAKDLAKLVKKYMKLGHSEEEATKNAESLMMMYAHHYDFRKPL